MTIFQVNPSQPAVIFNLWLFWSWVSSFDRQKLFIPSFWRRHVGVALGTSDYAHQLTLAIIPGVWSRSF